MREKKQPQGSCSRTAKGQFKKGCSGNPAGISLVEKSIEEIWEERLAAVVAYWDNAAREMEDALVL